MPPRDILASLWFGIPHIQWNNFDRLRIAKLRCLPVHGFCQNGFVSSRFNQRPRAAATTQATAAASPAPRAAAGLLLLKLLLGIGGLLLLGPLLGFFGLGLGSLLGVCRLA